MELLETLDSHLGTTAMESTIDSNFRDFDEALEQIVSEGRGACGCPMARARSVS